MLTVNQQSPAHSIDRSPDTNEDSGQDGALESRDGESEDPTDEPRDPSYIGANSTPSFVHGSPFAGNTGLEREVRPALGLQNTLHLYPFMPPDSAKNHLEELDGLVPNHADVLKWVKS